MKAIAYITRKPNRMPSKPLKKNEKEEVKDHSFK